jgi:glyoxylase-like metal-dependent hydrolase (beta-lactamase superfamily II)
VTQQAILGAAPAVAPGVWRVGGGSWNGLAEPLSAESDGNAYLVRLAGAAILVDCATALGAGAVARNVASVLGDGCITDLILTQSHWDHAEAATYWQGRLPELRTHLNSVGAAFLARGDHRLVGYQLQPPPHSFRAFRVDHAVDDWERFAIDDVQMLAVHVPGHTPDSTVYLVELDGAVVAFCGDVAFQARPDQGPVLGQLCTLWLSDLDEYVRGLERLCQLRIDVLLPGHGNAVRGRTAVASALDDTLRLAQALAADARFRENAGV